MIFKKYILTFLFILSSSLSYADSNLGGGNIGGEQARLAFKEESSSDIVRPRTIIVPNDTMTDNGNGTLNLNIASADTVTGKYVPYTGATKAVDLGSRNITTTGIASASTVRAKTLRTENYTFPESDGAVNQTLQTNGTGTLSFADSQTTLTGSISGTSNQAIVSVNLNTVAKSLTIGTPQDISIASNVQFSNLTVSNAASADTILANTYASSTTVNVSGESTDSRYVRTNNTSAFNSYRWPDAPLAYASGQIVAITDGGRLEFRNDGGGGGGGGTTLTLAQSTKTADYTITSTDYAIFCDVATNSIVITLPAAASVSGQLFVVKKISTDTATANIVTIDGNASELIDGSPTYSFFTPWQSVTIQSNGTNWFVE